MKIAIIGADGQLGTDLVGRCKQEGHTVSALTIDHIRVEDADLVRNVLQAIKPDAILNAAAYHHVPKCEEQMDLAFAVNAKGALNIARVAEQLNCINVYYSTDYVFDGKKGKPYIETDAPNPLNVYAASKLAGEYLTVNYCRRGIVIRISGIYGRIPSMMKGNNFVSMMIGLAQQRPEVKVVTDEILTPTPTTEIAEKTLELIRHPLCGIFHLTSEGECSWYEFTQAIFETLKIKTPLLPTTTKEFPSTVKRPLYSVLENSRFNALPDVQKMRHWKDALVAFLRVQYLHQ